MAHPQHNFTSNFNGSEGHNAELTLNINGVEKKYTPAGNDQTYNVPGVARIDSNLDGADLVQAIQTALGVGAQPVLVERSVYDEEVVYQYIGDMDGSWYFGICIVTKIVTIAVDKEDGAVNNEQIPIANGVVIVPSDGLNVYAQLRTALGLGQLPVLNYVGANSVYAQYEKTADNGDLIFVGALASASDTYVQYNIYTVSSNNTVTVSTRAASANSSGTPDDENGFFNSALYTTPDDGTTTSHTFDDFCIKGGTSIHGTNIEFVPTHQEDDIDFGEVYLNPGTYIVNIRYTLQWIGNPHGTFVPKVCEVGGQPFDFSYEHEDTLITSHIRVVTAREKVGVALPFDADTPGMGIWVHTLSIAQLASNTHPAVVHDTTLTGSGTAGSPLGITTDAFGKAKDIPTSVNQFRANDVIPVAGPLGPAKMEASKLLDLTARNSIVFTPNNNILWVGTSIPKYAEYPTAASAACGYSCINNSLGASTLCFPNTHPAVVESWSGRNLTATVNDLEVRYRQDVTNGVITEDQLNEWKNYSYERSILPYINGTDPTQVSAIIIDHGFNDRESIHTLMADVDNINWDSYARANFVGAFRFLFAQIVKTNPFVKVIIAGYFQNVVESYYSKDICDMQQLIAEKYDLPLMPAWKFSGINYEYVQNSGNYISNFNATYGTNYTKMDPNSSGFIPLFQFFCPDKVHPHSDLTGHSNIRLNAVYTKLLKFSI